MTRVRRIRRDSLRDRNSPVAVWNRDEQVQPDSVQHVPVPVLEFELAGLAHVPLALVLGHEPEPERGLAYCEPAQIGHALELEPGLVPGLVLGTVLAVPVPALEPVLVQL